MRFIVRWDVEIEVEEDLLVNDKIKKETVKSLAYKRLVENKALPIIIESSDRSLLETICGWSTK